MRALEEAEPRLGAAAEQLEEADRERLALRGRLEEAAALREDLNLQLEEHRAAAQQVGASGSLIFMLPERCMFDHAASMLWEEMCE